MAKKKASAPSSSSHRHDSSKRKSLRRAARARQGAHEDATLARQLDALGVRRKAMREDGNCLFRGVADVLFGDEGRHAEVRAIACAELGGPRRDDYAPFLLDEEDSGGGDFDKYLEAMREEGEWGGNLELQALSIALRVNLAIHQAGEPLWWVLNFPPLIAPAVHLAYCGGNHYDAVRDAGDDADDHGRPAEPVKILPPGAGDPHPVELAVLSAFPDADDRPTLDDVRAALRAARLDADTAIEELLAERHGRARGTGAAARRRAAAAASASSPPPPPHAPASSGAGAGDGDAGNDGGGGGEGEWSVVQGAAVKGPKGPRRNGPCPCGSLKLYRKCCEGVDRARAARAKHGGGVGEGGGGYGEAAGIDEATAALSGLRI